MHGNHQDAQKATCREVKNLAQGHKVEPEVKEVSMMPPPGFFPT
jgi:hypothetical protein